MTTPFRGRRENERTHSYCRSERGVAYIRRSVGHGRRGWMVHCQIMACCRVILKMCPSRPRPRPHEMPWQCGKRNSPSILITYSSNAYLCLSTVGTSWSRAANGCGMMGRGVFKCPGTSLRLGHQPASSKQRRTNVFFCSSHVLALDT